jgi:hypothetical protein
MPHCDVLSVAGVRHSPSFIREVNFVCLITLLRSEGLIWVIASVGCSYRWHQGERFDRCILVQYHEGSRLQSGMLFQVFCHITDLHTPYLLTLW